MIISDPDTLSFLRLRVYHPKFGCRELCVTPEDTKLSVSMSHIVYCTHSTLKSCIHGRSPLDITRMNKYVFQP